MAALDEDTLHGVSLNGEMGYEKWPAIIEPLLERLNQIVYHEFPVPQPYSIIDESQKSLRDSSSFSRSTVQISRTPTTPHRLPPVPSFPGPSIDTPTSHIPNSQPDQKLAVSDNDVGLPTIVLQQLQSIIATLRTSFSSRPPHTIQRLSELTLDPRRHYKTLPAWLRAVDRVVSVSSTADIFPLNDTPAIVNGVNGDGAGGILWHNNDQSRNGADGVDKDNGLGSDESLGGALLTPIPWLRDLGNSASNDSDSINDDLEGTGSGLDTSTDDLLGEEIQLPRAELSEDALQGLSHTHPSNSTSPTHSSSAVQSIPAALTSPTHDPLVPERPHGAVTQGELIRMEQEAGVIPVSHSDASSTLPRLTSSEHPPSLSLGIESALSSVNSPGGSAEEDPDKLQQNSEVPHARGPSTLNAVDVGLVDGRDMEIEVDSHPSTNHTNMSHNLKIDNAQHVLSGGPENLKLAEARDAKEEREHDLKATGSESGSDAGYVDVAKEVGESSGDAMHVDREDDNVNDKGSTTAKTEQHEDDGDIVLVDADGITEDERTKIDDSDVNVGSSTGDGTMH